MTNKKVTVVSEQALRRHEPESLITFRVSVLSQLLSRVVETSDHSQVSRASYELLDKGLIAMDSDQTDRRRQRLSVSSAGREVLRQGIVGSQARQDRLRARLSDAEYELLGRLLATLSDEAQKMLADTRESPTRKA